MNQKNIVILISGGGSNMAAIVDASRQRRWLERHGAAVTAVISSKADAGGLAWARRQGLACAALDHRAYPTREAFDAALMAQVDSHSPALVVLAGFIPTEWSPFTM